MPTRAKMVCQSVQSFAHGQRNYVFNAVVDNGTEENARYHKYTPNGKLELTVDNPAVEFRPGAEFYVDLTPVE